MDLALPLLQDAAVLVEEQAIPIAKAVGSAVATWGAEKIREKYLAYRKERKRSRTEAERTDVRRVPEPDVRLRDRERMAAYVKRGRKRRRRGSRKTRRTRRSRRSTRRVRSTRYRRSRRGHPQVNGNRVGVRWGLYYAGYDYNTANFTGEWTAYSLAANLGSGRSNTIYSNIASIWPAWGFLASNTTVTEQTCSYLWKGFKMVCPLRYPPVGRVKITIRVCLYNARTFEGLGASTVARLTAVHGEEGIKTMSQIPFRARPQKEAYHLLAKKTFTLSASNSEGGRVQIGPDGNLVTGYGVHTYLCNGTIIVRKTFRNPLYIRQYYTGTGNKNPGMDIGGGTTWTIGKSKTPLTIVAFLSFQQMDRMVPLTGELMSKVDNFEIAYSTFSWLHVDRTDAYRIPGGDAIVASEPTPMTLEPHRELEPIFDEGSEGSVEPDTPVTPTFEEEVAEPNESSAIPYYPSFSK